MKAGGDQKARRTEVLVVGETGAGGSGVAWGMVRSDVARGVAGGLSVRVQLLRRVDCTTALAAAATKKEKER